MTYWQEGDRIDKRAGEHYPRRVRRIPFRGTIRSIDRNALSCATVSGSTESLAYVDVVYDADDGHVGFARFFEPPLPPNIVPPTDPFPDPQLYREVTTDWRPDDRIEQSADQTHPRRITSAAHES
jgi:hypothetical protein